MGRVTSQDCIRNRGMSALNAISQLPERERHEFERHLRRCPSCLGQSREVASVASNLNYADPAHIEYQDEPSREPVRHASCELPPAFAESVFRRIRSEQDFTRKRSTWRPLRLSAIGVPVAAAVVGAALFLLPSSILHGPSTAGSGSNKPSPTIALSGKVGNQIPAYLLAERWGTSVEMSTRFGTPGQEMTVLMKSSSGSWWYAGSFTTTGSDSTVDLPCAVAPNQIKWIYILNKANQVVMTGYAQ